MRIWFIFVVLFGGSWLYAVEGRVYTDPKTGIRLVSTSVQLPSEGWWYVDPAENVRAPLGFTFIKEPENTWELSDQTRSMALELRRRQRNRNRVLWRLYWNKREQKNPLSSSVKRAVNEGWLHIREGVEIPEEFEKNPDILALETKPLVEDGKHWVLLANGTTRRIEIDMARWKQAGLTIEPDPLTTERPDSFVYTFHAHVLDPEAQSVSVTLKNDETGKEQTLTVNIGKAKGSRQDFLEWAEMRAWSWADLNHRIAALWVHRAADLYGLDHGVSSSLGRERNRGNTTGMLGVFGGAAAIRETLQVQNITPDKNPGEAPTVPIQTIPGVTVKAHDYAELLGDSKGKTVDLAKLCPPDRFWLYAPDPASLEPLLGGGADWMGALQGLLGGLQMDQQVLHRHLSRLGLTEATLRQFVKSGMIGETAVILPDLFLQDGTDVTCIARIRNLQAMSALFQARGIGPSPDPQTFTTPAGHTVTWAMRDDLFIMSTHKGEVDKVLSLHAAKGAGSLGDTAEFRYMLTQCGPGDSTRLYAYFSDPFIRRLTGPSVKIAQYRRMMARADLERVNAGFMLYRQDTGKDPDDLRHLFETGYIAPLFQLKEEEVELKEGLASHPEWGSITKMPTLLDTMPTLATEGEVAAYTTYRDAYSMFWRQFFDPIAIHVEAPEANTYEATVFVLPLIHSSIYDQIRRVLSSRGPIHPLPRPKMDPAPIAMMSINLAEENWLDLIEGLSDLFTDTIGIDLPIWDHIGPGLHIAIADSDSILTFGSGELAGLFNGSRWLRDSDMILFPMAATLFTRPAMAAVELNRPELALQKLRRMDTGSGWETSFGEDVHLAMVRVTGMDRWLIRLNLFGLLNINFSMEVQDGYLVISNQPMTYRPVVKGRMRPALHHASAWFNPEAADKTRRAFAGAALAKARETAQQGLGVLQAFHWSGYHEVETARTQSLKRFGFAPVHPAPGRFIDHPEGPESDTFGYYFEGRQPPLDEIAEPFGMFPFIEDLDVTFQLENEGFRARIKWRLKEKPPLR